MHRTGGGRQEVGHGLRTHCHPVTVGFLCWSCERRELDRLKGHERGRGTGKGRKRGPQ